MSGVHARAVAAAEARAAEIAAEIAGAIGTAVPGVSACAEGGDVVLTGRGLVRRAVRDPRLRAPGRQMR